MREIILLKQGEMVLKGQNKRTFEERLMKNLRYVLRPLGEFKLYSAQSTVYVEPLGDENIDTAVVALSKVFGLNTVIRCAVCEKDMKDISAKAQEYLYERLKNAKTFKVSAKRADKKFPLTSPEICAELGGKILEKFSHLKVDVINPDVTVFVEVRDYNAFIRGAEVKGAGGIPVGMSSKALLLLSGGIDSPVAGYMTAKRGVIVEAIHFHSYPYTSERAKEKVITLAKKMSAYTGRIALHIVPFTQIQEELRDKCKTDLFTVLMRRIMMRIAERIAEKTGAIGLITGESIGQVASQTMEAMAVTNSVVSIPVFRPVIALDKDEIIEIARKIDTFETSVLPYEDCCTVFAPKHPKTKPKLYELIAEEAKLDMEALIQNAVENTELMIV
ncbi:MAG: tRNA 4-thiouridine(8) synthase ThiI [Ruminococcaceae bacterium]|nr:tRNA 4-thiouridine(8) synthase ThiI [Oscillospiraceae bacterium]